MTDLWDPPLVHKYSEIPMFEGGSRVSEDPHSHSWSCLNWRWIISDIEWQEQMLSTHQILFLNGTNTFYHGDRSRKPPYSCSKRRSTADEGEINIARTRTFHFLTLSTSVRWQTTAFAHISALMPCKGLLLLRKGKDTQIHSWACLSLRKVQEY